MTQEKVNVAVIKKLDFFRHLRYRHVEMSDIFAHDIFRHFDIDYRDIFFDIFVGNDMS